MVVGGRNEEITTCKDEWAARDIGETAHPERYIYWARTRPGKSNHKGSRSVSGGFYYPVRTKTGVLAREFIDAAQALRDRGAVEFDSRNAD